jgi:hypothetical protein
MPDEQNIEALLKHLIAVDTLILATLLKGDKTSTGDYTDEAARLIQKRKSDVLRLLGHEK